MEIITDYSNVKWKENGKLKLLIIVGTRPEIIRLAAVISKCRKYFDCILAHTGQNYDYNLNGVFFNDLKLADPEVYMNAVGDTNSCLSAISAKRLHIPIFHMEAGNRCFDENLPEETNRRIVDHIADVNLCYSEHARRYLNAEGTARERTYVTGSPMAEVLNTHFNKILASDILGELGLKPKEYILLSAHREENIDNEQNFYELMEAINYMASTYQLPVIYSMHPRSRKFIEKRGFQFNSFVRAMIPFGFLDYNYLQMSAKCVVSDSGTLPEESAFFSAKGYPFAAVCIRTSTERPEAMDKGNFILSGIGKESVLQGIDTAIQMNDRHDMASMVPDYREENVSMKVIKIIQSYVTIVNRMVWRK